MLVPFVIEVGAIEQMFDETRYKVPLDGVLLHKSLIDLWQQYGILLYDGKNWESSNLYAYIEKLPLKHKQHWLAMLDGPSPPIGSIAEWQGDISPGELPLLCSARAELALVEDTRAFVDFEIEENDIERDFPVDHSSITVCRSMAFQHSRCIETRKKISLQHIEKRTSVETIWDTRFKNLIAAEFITHISVVDRFCIARHLFGAKHEPSGLEHWLKRIDNCSTSKKRITVFGSDKDLAGNDRARTKQDIKEEIRVSLRRFWDDLPNRNIQKLDVVVASDYLFGKLAHDRFYRMENYVWDIGSGLEIFEKPYVTKRHAASFKALGEVISEYKVIEDELRKDRKTYYVVEVLKNPSRTD